MASRFQVSDPYVRREIFLAAKKNNAIDWLREYKESFDSMDPWQRMAFIFGSADFPSDEKRYFINRWALIMSSATPVVYRPSKKHLNSFRIKRFPT